MWKPGEQKHGGIKKIMSRTLHGWITPHGPIKKHWEGGVFGRFMVRVKVQVED